jgi:protein involved in polysaccharide export with SLBB domain
MIKIENNNITIVKKDTAFITVAFDNYKLSKGDVLHFTVAEETESENPVIKKEYTSFSEDGSCVISLSSADTDLEANTYYYDVQVNLSDGRIDTAIGPSKFKIIEGVTV